MYKILKKTQASKCPSKLICITVFLYAFTLGQVISATKEEIIKAHNPDYHIQAVAGQIQTKQDTTKHDDSYQGNRGWLKCELLICVPCKLKLMSVLLCCL